MDRYDQNRESAKKITKTLGCTLVRYYPTWIVIVDKKTVDIDDRIMGMLARMLGLPWVKENETV